MALEYPRPGNDDAFEEFCLRFYRRLWKKDGLKRYGKRGESQDGIDIFDQLGRKPVWAIQCKHRESHKLLTKAEIELEVAKAEGSGLGLERFVIATTAKKSKKTQQVVLALNQRANKKFDVDIQFWEDVCELMEAFGRAQAELIVYGEVLLAGAAAASTDNPPLALSVTEHSHAPVGDSTDPLNAIEVLIERRRVEVARHELSKWPETDGFDALTRATQYQLTRLRAKVDLECDEYESAGRRFLAAFEISPDSEQSKQNRVLGHYLLKESAIAFRLAEEYIADGLRSTTLYQRLVQSAGTLEQIDRHEPELRSLPSDESLLVALAHKYLELGDLERARANAAAALQVAADSPYALLAMAMTCHQSFVHERSQGKLQFRRDALRNYELADETAKAAGLPSLRVEALVNRANLKAITGDASAAADLNVAVSLARNPQKAAARAASMFIHQRDFTAVRPFLKHLDTATAEGAYFSTIASYEEGPAEDRERLFLQMLELADGLWDRAVDCRFQCVYWAVEQKDYERAEKCLTPVFVAAHAFQAHVLKGWILYHRGDRDGAKSEVENANDCGIAGVRSNQLHTYARLLLWLGDDKNALEVLKETATAGVFDDAMRALLDCAQRLERHDVVLRLCEELRDCGNSNETLDELALETLSQYSPEAGLRLAIELEASHPERSIYRTFRCYYEARLGRLAADWYSPKTAARPKDFSTENVHFALFPLLASGLFEELLHFLYGHLRRNFEDEHCHGRYVDFFLRHGEQIPLLSAPRTVQPDCAVRISTASQSRWIVIEDDEPIASRSEFASNTELAVAMMGKAIGQSFQLPGVLIGDSTATIAETQPKFVRMFQDCVEHFQTRFPHAGMIQSISIPMDERLDSSPIVEVLRDRREFVEECLEAYSSTPISTFLLADRIGVSEYQVINDLAQSEKFGIRCGELNTEKFEEQLRRGTPEESIVLTLSAITTLSALDAWKWLDGQKKYVVGRLTSEAIDDLLIEAERRLRSTDGTMGLDVHGKVAYFERPREVRERSLEQLRAIRHFLDEISVRADSMGAAAIAPQSRRLYVNAVGLHNVEAVCVARDRGAILWSDDRVTNWLARANFAVQSRWTQLMLACRQSEGGITEAEYQLASAKLAAWGYVPTNWDAGTVLAYGEHCNWTTSDPMFVRCLALPKFLPKNSIATVELGKFLRGIRRSACESLLQSTVIQVFLNHLSDHKSVRTVLRDLNKLFRVDFPSEKFVRYELLHWLNTHIEH